MKNQFMNQIISSPGSLLEQELAEYYRLRASADAYREAHPRLDGFLGILTETNDVTMQINVSPAPASPAEDQTRLA